MSRQTETSLFIKSPLIESAGFYQQLFKAFTYEDMGKRILSDIKAAQAFRQVERVKSLSRILINNPLREFKLIAQYYLVWCEFRELKFDNVVLEAIIEQTQTYKAKALISRAASEVYQNNMERALYFYTEALRTNPTISDYIKASTGIATVKSMEGFHRSALNDLEGLIPLLGHADPLNYFEVFNSYAVELMANNKLREAGKASLIAVQSPFGSYYPEWQETAQGLKRRNRSFVVVKCLQQWPDNVLSMPMVERVNSGRISYNRPARVLNLQQWKMKMAKDPNRDEQVKKSLADMSEKEVFLRAIELFSNTKIPESKRRKMLEAVEKILAEPDSPNPHVPERNDSDRA
jgi:tetratricopeptide (TPR) repeat protein